MSDALASRLALARWLSPAFPLGSFAYSHGFEAAMAEGQVRTADEVRQWVGDLIRCGSARIDGELVALAMQPDADHAALTDMARAMAASRERLTETEEQGAALVRTLNAFRGELLPPAPLPVAFGREASGLGLPAAEVVALYLNAFATALVQAAVRFLPLGQTEGQAILSALAPAIADAAEAAGGTAPDDLGSASFGADMAAMRHETLDVRIFRT